MSGSDEKELLAKLQSGDRSAWKEILQKHTSPLIGYSNRMLGDRGAAEEVVQEALVQIYQNLSSFEGRCSIKSWLYRAVHNRSIDELRRKKRFVEPKQGEDVSYVFDERGHWAQACSDWNSSIEKDLNSKKMLSLVREQMDKLPHTHREVLLLSGIYELSHEEICDSLNISRENLRVRLHRARKALRDEVDKIVA